MYLSMRTLLHMRTIDSVLNGHVTVVKDVIRPKVWHMVHSPWYYYQLSLSLRKRGQTAPLAIGIDEETGEKYLVNGHHRVIIAYFLRWPGMQATCDPELSVDRAWNTQHFREDVTGWDW